MLLLISYRIVKIRIKLKFITIIDVKSTHTFLISCQTMNRNKLISWIAGSIWGIICLHGLSFWTMRRLSTGKLKVVFTPIGFTISFVLFSFITYCLFVSIFDQLKSFTSDDYMQVDRLSSFFAAVLVFVTIPVIFFSVWTHHRKLKAVGEKIICISEILGEIDAKYDKYVVQKELCKRIAPVVVGYFSLFSMMIYMFKKVMASTGGFWKDITFLIGELSPIYLIFMSIVKITCTLCITASRFHRIEQILDAF